MYSQKEVSTRFNHLQPYFRRTTMSQNTARNYLQEVAERHSITDLTSRELAQKLDEADELHHLRQNFHIPRMATLPEGQF